MSKKLTILNVSKILAEGKTLIPLMFNNTSSVESDEYYWLYFEEADDIGFIVKEHQLIIFRNIQVDTSSVSHPIKYINIELITTDVFSKLRNRRTYPIALPSLKDHWPITANLLTMVRREDHIPKMRVNLGNTNPIMNNISHSFSI